MTTMEISPLKKVSLAVISASPHDSVESEEHFFSFIYGAASRGLSPFEIQLADRSSGEALDLTLDQENIQGFFGHLFKPLKNCLTLHILPQQLHLRVTVNRVEMAEDYEIVTAIKDSIGSGCGCDCGCNS